MPISIDTYKAAVGRAAVAAGAHDRQRHQRAAVRRSARQGRGGNGRGGRPDAHARALQRDVRASRGTTTPRSRWRRSCAPRWRAPPPRELAVDAMILDPGIGFAKRAEHSAEVLARLATFADLEPSDRVGPVAKVLSQGGTRRSYGARPRVGHSGGGDRQHPPWAPTSSAYTACEPWSTWPRRRPHPQRRWPPACCSSGITEEVTDGTHGPRSSG